MEKTIIFSSIVVQLAVSNFTGQQTFYTNVDGSSDSNELGSLGKIDPISGGQKVSVKTTTLDDFVRSHKISTIPVLKVDVEGWEGAVFQGAKHALKLIDFIVFECSDTIDDSRGTGHTLHDIVKILARARFMVFKIGTRYILRLDGYPPEHFLVFASHSLVVYTGQNVFGGDRKYWDPVYEKERFWSNCIAVSNRLGSFVKDAFMDRNRRHSMVLDECFPVDEKRYLRKQREISPVRV